MSDAIKSGLRRDRRERDAKKTFCSEMVQMAPEGGIEVGKSGLLSMEMLPSIC